MRTLRGGVIAVAAAFGLTLFALSVYKFWDLGSCASGPNKYGITRACPHASNYWLPALVGSIAWLGGVAALARNALLGPLGLLCVGGGSAAALITGAAHSDGVIGAAVLAVLFLSLGGFAAWTARGRLSARSALVLAPSVVGAAAAVAVGLAIPGPFSEPKQAGATPTVTARGAGSWFAAPNLRRLLAETSSRLGPQARIASIMLTPAVAVVDAYVAGTDHSLNFTVGAAPEDYPSAGSASHAVPAASIDSAAPARLLAEVGSRFHVDAAQVEHVDFSLDPVSGAPRWEAFLADKTTDFQSGPHGTGAKRVAF